MDWTVDHQNQSWPIKRFRSLRFPAFQDNRNMKMVRLSDLRTGRLYHTGDTLGAHFC
jgi:hypothetical protein